MFHNEYLGNETLTREYKEFTFNHGGLEIDPIVAEDLIKSSKWIFNDLIKINIQKYLRIYLPKYTAGFMDVLSETPIGELYIGVNDAGVVQGIPFQGNLNIDFIVSDIQNVINEYVVCSNEQKKILLDNITTELIEIDYVETKLPETHELLLKYYELRDEFNLKEKEFALDFSKWYKTFIMYTQKKLVELFNNDPTRKQLYDYIQTKKPDSPVLKMMDDGYLLETKTHEEISVLKDDINHPYYWICEWKDLTIDNLKLIKPTPKHRIDFPPMFNPVNILTKLNCMIPWWMQQNNNMKLYLIKITFKKHHDIKEIYYRDSLNKVNRCFRSTFYDSPCCTPV